MSRNNWSEDDDVAGGVLLEKKEKTEKLSQMTSEHGMHALEFYFPKLSKKLRKRKIKMRYQETKT